MLRVLKFSGMRVRFPKPRARRCAPRARMDAPKLLRHNWRKCIGNRMASLFATAFFTITNRRGAERTFRQISQDLFDGEFNSIRRLTPELRRAVYRVAFSSLLA